MKKGLIAIVLQIALICCSCTANNMEDESDIKSHIVGNGDAESGQKDYLSVFSVLNKPILIDSLDLMGLTGQEVNQYLDDIADYMETRKGIWGRIGQGRSGTDLCVEWLPIFVGYTVNKDETG